MNSEMLWDESGSVNDVRRAQGVCEDSHDVEKRQDPKDEEAPLVG